MSEIPFQYRALQLIGADAAAGINTIASMNAALLKIKATVTVACEQLEIETREQAQRRAAITAAFAHVMGQHHIVLPTALVDDLINAAVAVLEREKSA